MLKIPEKIQYVMNVLMRHGFDAYIVGGCVRDALLGLIPSDYDISTSALPKAVMETFPRTVPTGIKHGTVTVIIDGQPVEVTTFRTDGEYSDSRRPDSVDFVTDLKKDLSRRDFTVNAMAYNPETGLVDYFGGRNDLENKILRAVGDPEKRFLEDALRILRLFRFSSCLGFDIEDTTLKAALKLCGRLQNISSERIFTELLKAIKGKNPAALAPLIKCGGLAFLGLDKIPDFSILKALNGKQNLCLFAFLYFASDRPLTVLEKLKASNAQKNYCERLLTLSEEPLPLTKPQIKEQLFKTSIEAVSDRLLFLKSTGEGITSAQKMLDEILKNKEPYLISHLKINGKTLEKLGYNGSDIGNTLEKLRKIVVQNPDMNRAEILLKLVSEF
ncbi:MAG: CCA tRNA nucleotidyltransferase [Acutalibacteraceae bacterium]|jgi:tRNA nucleotidyltransferase (CCA-adding enzyme)